MWPFKKAKAKQVEKQEVEKEFSFYDKIIVIHHSTQTETIYESNDEFGLGWEYMNTKPFLIIKKRFDYEKTKSIQVAILNTNEYSIKKINSEYRTYKVFE